MSNLPYLCVQQRAHHEWWILSNEDDTLFYRLRLSLVDGISSYSFRIHCVPQVKWQPGIYPLAFLDEMVGNVVESC